MLGFTPNEGTRQGDGMKVSEKVTRYGAHTLSDSELVGIVTGAGVDAGRAVVQEFGSFREMSRTDGSRWSGIAGLGDTRRARVMAALEIGKRFMAEQREIKGSLRSPEDIAEMFMPRLRDLQVETFLVVLLDGRNNVLEVAEIATGTPAQCVPHVRTIITEVLRRGAVGVVCVHNHPSGNTSPSRDDKMFTKVLQDACGTMDVKLVDHIVIGDNSFFSFVEGGLL